MKKIICLFILSCFVVPAFASYEFTDTLGQTALINVDCWTGSGSSETILVVDWNKSGDYESESHSFGYRWDGSDTSILDMLNDITSNPNFDFSFESSSYGYLSNMTYTDSDGDQHTQVATEFGSVNMASTGDLHAEWGSPDAYWTMFGEWEANGGGLADELIADGQLEGVNFFYYFQQDTYPYENLDVTFVPEPVTLALMSLGGILIRRRK